MLLLWRWTANWDISSRRWPILMRLGLLNEGNSPKTVTRREVFQVVSKGNEMLPFVL
jgi:hypothetical protein